MKTQLLVTMFAGGLFITSVANAQLMNAAKGLEKIKSNLDAAQKNKVDYVRVYDVTKENVSEVQKAKETTLSQKKSVNSEISKSNEAHKKAANQERDLKNYITKETDKIALETKQIEQLQALINQIKKNQEQREMIINDYKAQLGAVGLNKNAWQEREAKLKAQDDQTTQSLRSITSEEVNWVAKKRKHESDAKLWTAEADKQQKIHDTYQGLSAGK